LLFAETPKSKIRSPAVGGFPQSDVLFYNCLLWAFATAVSAAEWFFIAAYQSRPVRRGLSAAMKKEILLSVLWASSEASKAGPLSPATGGKKRYPPPRSLRLERSSAKAGFPQCSNAR